jgi:hypothetical protein
MKQTETIRSEKVFEFADAHRQNSSRGSGSGDHHCRACDTYWAHMSLFSTPIHPRLSALPVSLKPFLRRMVALRCVLDMTDCMVVMYKY